MANMKNICDSIDTLKRLVMIQNCFSVKMQAVVMAELCCLSKLSYPVDGFQRVSEPLGPGKSLSLIDNQLDLSPNVAEIQARGIILCMNFPKLDINGADLDDALKCLYLDLVNHNNQTITIPVYNAFIHLANPVTSDWTMVLNRVVVHNDSDKFVAGVEALLLMTSKTGVTLPYGIACNC